MVSGREPQKDKDSYEDYANLIPTISERASFNHRTQVRMRWRDVHSYVDSYALCYIFWSFTRSVILHRRTESNLPNVVSLKTSRGQRRRHQQQPQVYWGQIICFDACLWKESYGRVLLSSKKVSMRMAKRNNSTFSWVKERGLSKLDWSCTDYSQFLNRAQLLSLTWICWKEKTSLRYGLGYLCRWKVFVRWRNGRKVRRELTKNAIYDRTY